MACGRHGEHADEVRRQWYVHRTVYARVCVCTCSTDNNDLSGRARHHKQHGDSDQLNHRTHMRTRTHARTRAQMWSLLGLRSSLVLFYFLFRTTLASVACCNSANANTESMQYHAHHIASGTPIMTISPEGIVCTDPAIIASTAGQTCIPATQQGGKMFNRRVNVFNLLRCLNYSIT